MKRLIASLSTAVLLVMPFASIAAPAPGTLIKGSGSSVYYYGNDGKRYVFPTEKTFFTWYSDFSSVATISDQELGSITIGGNVTYRPGLRMVKITTDPKVYAVSANGSLRWVMTEGVAQDLYGANWNTKIDDVPDPFFINYHIGGPLSSATDFSASSETAAATSIAVDRGLTTPNPPPAPPSNPTPPTPTPTSTAPYYSGTITVSKNPVSVNETINLRGEANPQSGIASVNLYFDGALAQRCEYSPCSSDVRVSTTKTSYDAVARFDWITGQRSYATTTVNVTAGSQAGVMISVTRPEVRPGSLREVVVSSDSNFVAKTIDIYIDGFDARGCTDQQSCRYAGTEEGTVGTVHSVYAVLRDANGTAKQTETKTITVVSNEHPYITVELGKNLIFRGEKVDATVRASDDNGVDWSEIWVDGVLVKHCSSSICTADVGPWSMSRTVQVVGRSQDTTTLIGYGTSTDLMVQ